MTKARWNFARIPGLEAEKDAIRRRVREGRIPHAQLFLGDYGTATLGMALAAARLILCDESGEEPCETCSACNVSYKWAHPNLHFSFPVVGTDLTSKEFLPKWREMLDLGPWFSPSDWFAYQGEEKKLGNINVAECKDIVNKLSYIPAEGQFKIMIIYGLEFLSKEGNRLLKLIEEPPERTLFLFVAADGARILPTILSRCQIIRIRPFSDDEILEALEAHGVAAGEAAALLAFQADGNLGQAFELAGDEGQTFSGDFIHWMRLCFKSTGSETINLANTLGALSREEQKRFLGYALHFIRQMVYTSVGLPDKIRLPDAEKRSAIGMAGQLDVERLEEMAKLFENTLHAVERNANMKIQFLHLSIQLHALFNNRVRYTSTINFI